MLSFVPFALITFYLMGAFAESRAVPSGNK